MLKYINTYRQNCRAKSKSSIEQWNGIVELSRHNQYLFIFSWLFNLLAGFIVIAEWRASVGYYHKDFVSASLFFSWSFISLLLFLIAAVFRAFVLKIDDVHNKRIEEQMRRL